MADFPISFKFLGNKEKAFTLAGFATQQVGLLRQLMAFQRLVVGARQYSSTDGDIIEIRICGNITTATIYCPFPGEVFEEEIIRKQVCWCTCCFAEAVVLEVITPSLYSWYGYYSPDQSVYPDVCNLTDISVQNYTGIRYRCWICQKDHGAEWICISSDFAEYSVGDSVVVLFRGNWRGNIQDDSRCFGCNSGCGTQACQANWPEGRVFSRTWNLADGTFVIVPLEVGNIGRPQT